MSTDPKDELARRALKLLNDIERARARVLIMTAVVLVGGPVLIALFVVITVLVAWLSLPRH